ncbi:MAG: metallophosphoesterase [Candidatus Dojkabacteria bacterium]
MFDNHKVVKLGKKEDTIACIGDAHDGHPNHRAETFNGTIDEVIKNKYKVVLMGDMMECREPSHPLYVPGSPTVGEQMNRYLDLIDRLNDNDALLGVICGNHEHKLIEKMSNNEIERWCNKIKVNYLDYSGVMDFEHKDHVYSVVFHHGFGGGATIGGAANALVRFTRYFQNFDAVIMAHTHQLAALPPTIFLERDKESHKMIDRYCFPAFTGSFFLTYDEGKSGYGERKGYSPLPMGYNLLTFNDGLAQSRSVVKRVH